MAGGQAQAVRENSEKRARGEIRSEVGRAGFCGVIPLKFRTIPGEIHKIRPLRMTQEPMFAVS